MYQNLPAVKLNLRPVVTSRQHKIVLKDFIRSISTYHHATTDGLLIFSATVNFAFILSMIARQHFCAHFSTFSGSFFLSEYCLIHRISIELEHRRHMLWNFAGPMRRGNVF